MGKEEGLGQPEQLKAEVNWRVRRQNVKSIIRTEAAAMVTKATLVTVVEIEAAARETEEQGSV
ncbi:hypothetical protein IEQ34_022011 [Dendrobium chrysotoxum]|uniref:Uncharacterized protein n=1 Tax=Dendrobium chrysotoxum TaxID=161865 RepID=A0AAV7FW06_DENCH|nr:hypothetical protein IEQ34_022011 [Dendrobium chrysotoxum]